MRLAAFNINFDSLNEMYGFPPGYRDRTYFEVSKRFFALSDKYGFKYSIYVIGKDLEKAENRELVREWSLKGHEIGNHSWSHPLNLGALSPSELRREVESSHAIITKATGKEPRGFIAPGWSTSSALQKILIEMNYLYDTSGFPSWLMYLSLAKMLMINWGDQRFKRILNRKDLLSPFLSPRAPYVTSGDLYQKSSDPGKKGLVILPLPTNRLRVACWHTMGFIFGWPLHEALLKSCLDRFEAFYYLMHPGDLLDKSDLDSRHGRILMERLEPSVEDKQRFLEKSIQRVLQSGRKIVTMEELARQHAA